MRYMGSKSRHAKYLLPIILKDRNPEQWYVEPFVGGFNLMDKVEGKRLASDAHPYLISLFQAMQGGWTPPFEIDEETYRDVRLNKDLYTPYFVGFVGFACSFSGKWFGGYARGGYQSNGQPRNYGQEGLRALVKQVAKLKDVVIVNCSYDQLSLPDNSIIYCDPPYQSTTGYATGNFDHDKFWEWCRTKTRDGHKVFISEYTAPEDFETLWEKEVSVTVKKDAKDNKAVEKLFTYKGGVIC